MTAPIASGWSESPGGPCTHWKAPPCHGAPPLRPFVRGPAYAASSGKCGFRRAYTVEGCSSVRSLSGSLLKTLRCAHLKIAHQPGSHLFLQDDPKVRVSEAVCNDG